MSVRSQFFLGAIEHTARFIPDEDGGARNSFVLAMAILAAVSAGYKADIVSRFSLTHAPPAQTLMQDPNTCTSLAGTRAQDKPTEVYMIDADHFANDYRFAVSAFRNVMQQQGSAVPDYIDETYLMRTATKESLNGRVAYEPGNSYQGLFAISPGLPESKSHFAHLKAKIAAILNQDQVKKEIPVLRDCSVVQPDMLDDSGIFPNVRVQAISALVMAYHADKQLSDIPNYAKLSPDMKRAALYFHHNLPAVAAVAIKYIDSKESIYTLIGREYPPAVAATLTKMMARNPAVYPQEKIIPPAKEQAHAKKHMKLTRPKKTVVTAAQVLDGYLKSTAQGLAFLEQGAKPVRNFDSIGAFISDSNRVSRVKAAGRDL